MMDNKLLVLDREPLPTTPRPRDRGGRKWRGPRWRNTVNRPTSQIRYVIGKRYNVNFERVVEDVTKLLPGYLGIPNAWLSPY